MTISDAGNVGPDAESLEAAHEQLTLVVGSIIERGTAAAGPHAQVER